MVCRLPRTHGHAAALRTRCRPQPTLAAVLRQLPPPHQRIALIIAKGLGARHYRFRTAVLLVLLQRPRSHLLAAGPAGHQPGNTGRRQRTRCQMVHQLHSRNLKVAVVCPRVRAQHLRCQLKLPKSDSTEFCLKCLHAPFVTAKQRSLSGNVSSQCISSCVLINAPAQTNTQSHKTRGRKNKTSTCSSK